MAIPTRTRMELAKFANLFKSGSVIFCAKENLRDEMNMQMIPAAFYGVRQASVTRSFNKHDAASPYTYALTLAEVQFDEDKKSWKCAGQDRKVSVKYADLNEAFGILTGNEKSVQAAKYHTVVTALIQHVFREAGKSDLLDLPENKNHDYDKIFGAIADNMARKNPMHIDEDDLTDMINEAATQVITPQTVAKYDGKSDIVKYFGGMFQNRMKDQIKPWTTRHIRERQEVDNPSGDFTQEEKLDYTKNQLHRDTRPDQEQQVGEKELLIGLTNFLKKQPNHEWMMTVFSNLLNGASNKDIAKHTNTSEGNISKQVQKLRELIMEYAKQSDNNLLADLMVEISKSKKHALGAGDELDLKEVMKRYKQKVGMNTNTNEQDIFGHTAPLGDREDSIKRAEDETAETSINPAPEVHKPAGDVISVERNEMEDKANENYMAKAIMSDKLTANQVQDDLTAHFQELDDQDDLVDDVQTGKIIGLKVTETPKRLESEPQQTVPAKPVKPQPGQNPWKFPEKK